MPQLHLLTVDGRRLGADASPGSGTPVVLCHPDPRFGGDRRHVVVDTIYRSLADAGRAVIRFDFRADPADHLEAMADLLAAIDHIAEHGDPPSISAGSPDTAHRVHLVGYSFGALVAAELTRRQRESVASLTMIAPPTVVGDPSPIPTQLIIATHDQFRNPEQIDAMISVWDEPPSVVELAGTDHFLLGAAARVCDAVGNFIDRFDPVAPH